MTTDDEETTDWDELEQRATNPPDESDNPTRETMDEPTRAGLDIETDGGDRTAQTSSLDAGQYEHHSRKAVIGVLIAGLIAGGVVSQAGIEGLIGLIGAVVGIEGINKRTQLITEEARNEPIVFAVGVVVGWAIVRFTTEYTITV